MSSALTTSVESWRESMDQPTMRRGEGIQDRGAVDPAFPRAVDCDVGNPRLVRFQSMEFPVHDVDFEDQPGQPLAPQLCRRGRAPFGFVVVLPGHAEHSAASVYRCPGCDEAVDHRGEPPCGPETSSPRSFAAWRMIASSVSSSRIRRRAARSSADSAEGLPGRSPWSMSSGATISTTSPGGSRVQPRSAWPVCRPEPERSLGSGTRWDKRVARGTAFR